jgi:hypothetical protein
MVDDKVKVKQVPRLDVSPTVLAARAIISFAPKCQRRGRAAPPPEFVRLRT